MKLKTSLFDKGILQSDLKRFWWIGALYAVLLFLAVPFRFMTQTLPIPVEEQWRWHALDGLLRLEAGGSSYNSFNGLPVQTLLICAVPVFLAVMLFRYLHSPRAVGMVHSLPVKRTTLLGSHTASGILLFSAPVLLSGIVLAALALFTGLGEYYGLVQVAQWAGWTLLYDLFLFSAAVFVGMFTGNALAQAGFTYILNILPFGLYLLVACNLEKLLYGFDASALSNGWARVLPLMRVVFSDKGFSWGEGAVYFLIVLALLAGAGLAYRLRKSEAAGNIIAFEGLRPVFRYGFAVCLMLLGGFIAAYLFDSGSTAVMLACVLSAVAGYWVSLMLVKKTVNVWRGYRGCLVFTAVIVVLLAGVSADLTGYVRYEPRPDEIVSAYYGSNYNGWRYEEDHKQVGLYFQSEGRFAEKANIEAVLKLHERLAASRSENGREKYIAYSLESGRTVFRKYKVEESAVEEFLRPLYESEEYRKDKYPILNQAVRNLKTIEIGDRRTDKKPLVLSDAKQMESFAQVMRTELSRAGYEEIIKSESQYMYIRITDAKNFSCEYSLNRDYGLIRSWLEENGYAESILLQPAEIQRVDAAAMKLTRYKGGIYGYSYSTAQAYKITQLEDAKLIGELMEICTSGYTEDTAGQYFQLNFYNGDTVGPSFTGYVDLRTAPMSGELRKKLEEIGK